MVSRVAPQSCGRVGRPSLSQASVDRPASLKTTQHNFQIGLTFKTFASAWMQLWSVGFVTLRMRGGIAVLGSKDAKSSKGTVSNRNARKGKQPQCPQGMRAAEMATESVHPYSQDFAILVCVMGSESGFHEVQPLTMRHTTI
jgi:hypothetical protein